MTILIRKNLTDRRTLHPKVAGLQCGIHLIWICLLVISGTVVGHSHISRDSSCVKDSCNNGVCEEHSNNTFSCFCENGFTGYYCETNWNECYSEPCLNGAKCNDLIAKFECLCSPGFTGITCETEINECLSNPCQNNGTCTDFLDKYSCTCLQGFSGSNCEIDISVCNASKPKCQNGGLCIDRAGLQFFCKCPSKWEGTFCEIDVDECLNDPCYNGATCHNYVGGFTCSCMHGFTGHLCEEQLSLCSSSPCRNGALCVVENGNKTCYCVPDFHGDLCQFRYNDCLPYAPRCQNNGTCIDGVDSFKCICPPKVDGSLCHCVISTEGKICQPLPDWYEEKEYHPIPTEPTPISETTSVSDRTKLFSEDYEFELYPSTAIDGSYFTIVQSEIPSANIVPSSITEFSIFPTISTDLYTIDLLPEVETTIELWPTLTLDLEPTDFVISYSPTPTLDATITPFIDVTSSILESSFSIDSKIVTYEIPRTSEILSYSTPVFDETLLNSTISSTAYYSDAAFLNDYPKTISSTIALPDDEFILSTAMFDSNVTTYDSDTTTSFSSESLSTEESILTNISATEDQIIENITDSTLTTLIYSVNETTETSSLVPEESTNATLILITTESSQSVTSMTTESSDLSTETVKPVEAAEVTTPWTVLDKSTTPLFEVTEFDSSSKSINESVEVDTITSPVTETIDYDATSTPKFDSTSSTGMDELNETSISIDISYTVSKDSFSPEFEYTTTPIDSFTSEISTSAEEDLIYPDNITAFTTPIPDTSLSVTDKAIFYPEQSSTTKDFVAETNLTDVFPTIDIVTEVNENDSLLFISKPAVTQDGQLTESEYLSSTTPTVYEASTVSKDFSYETTFSESTKIPELNVSEKNITFIDQFSSTASTVSMENGTDLGNLTTQLLVTTKDTAIEISQPSVFTQETEAATQQEITTSVDSFLITEKTTKSTTDIPESTTMKMEDASDAEVTEPTTLIAVQGSTSFPSTTSEIASTIRGLTIRPVESDQTSTASTLKVDITDAGMSTEVFKTSSISPDDSLSTTEVITLETTTLFDDSCEVTKCYNGGTCTAISSKKVVVSEVEEAFLHLEKYMYSSCQCTFNYTGDSCQSYQYINKPHFSGISYLKMNGGQLILRQGVQLYIQFTSESPNGLLAYSEGNAKSFFMLLLRNSLLQFVFSCGLQTVSYLQGNEKLSSFSETDVLVRLWWVPYSKLMPWGPGKCSAFLQLNNSSPVYSEQESASAEVKLGHIFLGGLPQSYSSPMVVKAGLLPRLKGCISLIEINEVEFDPWLVSVEGEAVGECGKSICPKNACFNGGTCQPGPAFWSCVCPFGFEGSLCERKSCYQNPCNLGICLTSSAFGNDSQCICSDQSNGPLCNQNSKYELGTRFMYPGSYRGYASYTTYKINFEHRRDFIIRLHFTTTKIDQLGLLVYLGANVNSVRRDFIALALVRGYLLLTWDLGSGPRRIVSVSQIDKSWHTHSVRFGRSSRLSWMEVDTQKNISAAAPGFLSSLESNGVFHLGGHPSWNFTHLPADLFRIQGFKGCIFDVRIAKTVNGPWMIPEFVTSSGVGQCDNNRCNDHSCQNGAKCQPIGMTYKCICNPGWKGAFCEHPSHECENLKQSCYPGSTCIGIDSKSLPICLCPYGKTGYTCEKETQISDIKLLGPISYLTIHGGNYLRSYSSVSLDFKPDVRDGILFMAVPVGSQTDFLVLYIKNETMRLAFQLGSFSNPIELKATKLVENEKWQSVSFLRRADEAKLNFGSDMIIKSASFVQEGDDPNQKFDTSYLLDVQSEIFLGGPPDSSMIPHEVDGLKHVPSFRGCIRNVRIGDFKYNLDVQDNLFGVIRGQGIGDCDNTSCGSEVCQNNATCKPTNRNTYFTCSCSKDFFGERCETPKQCVDHKCQNEGECDPITIRRTAKSNEIVPNSVKLGYSCLCPAGRSGQFCEEESVVTSAQFSEKSFAMIPEGCFLGPSDMTRDSISLNFSSSNTHGLILWRGRSHEKQNDFLGLGIEKARIKFIWHLGGDILGVISPTKNVCDGKWHSVSITRYEKVVTLFLDGIAFKTSTKGEFTQLNAPNIIYLGGFPDKSPLKHLTFHHFQKNSFSGCMKDVRLHSASPPVIFSDLKQGRDLQKCSSRDYSTVFKMLKNNHENQYPLP